MKDISLEWGLFLEDEAMEEAVRSASIYTEDVPIPEGEYECLVVDVQATVNKNDKPQVVWRLEIISGKYKGITILKRDTMYNATSLKIFVENLWKAGHRIESIKSLRDELHNVVGNLVLIRIKKNEKDFKNVYVVKEIQINNAVF